MKVELEHKVETNNLNWPYRHSSKTTHGKKGRKEREERKRLREKEIGRLRKKKGNRQRERKRVRGTDKEE